MVKKLILPVLMMFLMLSSVMAGSISYYTEPDQIIQEPSAWSFLGSIIDYLGSIFGTASMAMIKVPSDMTQYVVNGCYQKPGWSSGFKVNSAGWYDTDETCVQGGGGTSCSPSCTGGKVCQSGSCVCPSNKPNFCNGQCQSASCGAGGCDDDNDCDYNKYCSSGSCKALSCPSGTSPVDHICKPIEQDVSCWRYFPPNECKEYFYNPGFVCIISQGYFYTEQSCLDSLAVQNYLLDVSIGACVPSDCDPSSELYCYSRSEDCTDNLLNFVGTAKWNGDTCVLVQSCLLSSSVCYDTIQNCVRDRPLCYYNNQIIEKGEYCTSSGKNLICHGWNDYDIYDCDYGCANGECNSGPVEICTYIEKWVDCEPIEKPLNQKECPTDAVKPDECGMKECDIKDVWSKPRCIVGENTMLRQTGEVSDGVCISRMFAVEIPCADGYECVGIVCSAVKTCAESDWTCSCLDTEGGGCDASDIGCIWDCVNYEGCTEDSRPSKHENICGEGVVCKGLPDNECIANPDCYIKSSTGILGMKGCVSCPDMSVIDNQFCNGVYSSSCRTGACYDKCSYVNAVCILSVVEEECTDRLGDYDKCAEKDKCYSWDSGTGTNTCASCENIISCASYVGNNQPIGVGVNVGKLSCEANICSSIGPCEWDVSKDICVEKGEVADCANLTVQIDCERNADCEWDIASLSCKVKSKDKCEDVISGAECKLSCGKGFKDHIEDLDCSANNLYKQCCIPEEELEIKKGVDYGIPITQKEWKELVAFKDYKGIMLSECNSDIHCGVKSGYDTHCETSVEIQKINEEAHNQICDDVGKWALGIGVTLALIATIAASIFIGGLAIPIGIGLTSLTSYAGLTAASGLALWGWCRSLREGPMGYCQAIPSGPFGFLYTEAFAGLLWWHVLAIAFAALFVMGMMRRR